MKRILCGVTSLGSIVTALLLSVIAPIAARAELAWETKAIERVVELNESTVRVAFPFRNPGPRPITITSIETSCGCTVASLPKKTYGPGESGRVDVVYEIGNQFGAQEKTITLVSDEMPDRPMSLTLRAAIPEPYAVWPQSVWWTVGETPDEKLVMIQLNPAAAAEISLPVPVPKDIHARLERGPDANTFRLWLKPNSTKENFESVVTLQFQRAKLAPTSVRVHAQVR